MRQIYWPAILLVQKLSTILRAVSMLLIINCLYSHPINGQRQYFDYNKSLQQAYEKIIYLNTNTASIHLDSLRIHQPDNLAITHIENYIDFLISFLSEKKEDYKRFGQNLNKRLEHLQNSNTADNNAKELAIAEMKLQYAMVAAKHGDLFRAGRLLISAYRILKKLEKRKYLPCYKSLSVIHSLIGSLSGLQQGLIRFLTPIRGDIDKGIAQINYLYNNSNNDDFFYPEIVIIRTLIAYHVEKDGATASRLISTYWDKFHNNSIISFIHASILLQEKDTPQAVRILEEQINSPSEIELSYLHLMLGNARLTALDTSAREHIAYFLRHHQGLHYLLEARQKLAWSALVFNGDTTNYWHLMSEIKKMTHAEIGEDQDALFEANMNRLPHTTLLKARLLCDGGYFKRAKDEILSIQETELSDQNRIEYYYRKARIADGLEQINQAIQYYTDVLQADQSDYGYYSCASALYLGNIFDNLGSPEQARKYWLLCLQLKPQQHRKGLHQKARLNLARTKEK